MMLCKIISIASQKGGVGKTTTTVNLGTALAVAGKKTLVIDLDPQGNTSTGMGIPIGQRQTTIYEVLVCDVEIENAILATSIPNLDIITSNVNLAATEIELVGINAKEIKLKNKLSSITPKYDYIFIDCGPSLGLLTINALSASHSLIIPLQCEFFAMEGLAYLLNTISFIQHTLNPSLYLEGILLTMNDRRNKLSQQVEEEVRGQFSDLVYKTVIPRNIKLSEAPSHGKPAIIYDTKCLGSIAYLMLANELINKNTRLNKE